MKKGKKRAHDTDGATIQQIYADHKKSQLEREERFKKKSNVEMFFEGCAERVKALDSTLQGIVQIQFQQILFNAENPHVPPIPIMPLPRAPTTPLNEVGPLQSAYNTLYHLP